VRSRRFKTPDIRATAQSRLCTVSSIQDSQHTSNCAESTLCGLVDPNSSFRANAAGPLRQPLHLTKFHFITDGLTDSVPTHPPYLCREDRSLPIFPIENASPVVKLNSSALSRFVCDPRHLFPNLLCIFTSLHCTFSYNRGRPFYFCLFPETYISASV